MPKFSEQIVDDSGYRRPVGGVPVYLLNADNTLANTTSPNPTLTDDFGSFSFFAIDGVYNFDARLGGVSIAKGSAIIGDPPQYVGLTGPADNTYDTYAELLASDPTRKSARLVPAPGETEPAGNFAYINGAWVRQAADGVSATQDIAGTAVAPLIAKYRQTVSVRDFAGGDPSNDEYHTDAWNAATQATAEYGDSIDGPLMYKVYVPAPRRGERWRIGENNKSVFVRRGQHLTGDGIACHVDLQHCIGNTNPIIWVGVGPDYLAYDGSQNGYAGDPSGVGTEVSNLWFHGCPSSVPVIDTTYQAGWWITKCFFTSNAISIRAGGGDGKIRGVQIDQGLVGIDLYGANINIVDTNLYLLNYAIRVSRAYDCAIIGCEIEYPQYAGILIGNGQAGNSEISGLLVQSNLFTMNVQYPTFDGYININASNPQVAFRGNSYRNCPGFAVKRSLGVGGYLSFVGEVFDGARTNPLYTQGTTMGGIEWSDGDMGVSDSVFLRMPGQPVRQRPGGATVMTLAHNRFIGNTGGNVEVQIDASDTGGALRLADNFVDARLITNPQGIIPVYADRIATGQITLVGGTATVAAPLVRQSSRVTIQRHIDGGTVAASYSISRNTGVGFTITAKDGAGATQALDTSIVNWTLELAGI